MSAQPWRRALPADRDGHFLLRHRTFTTSHRPGWGGRFCWTCRLVLAEWPICGETKTNGWPCLARPMNGLTTCATHYTGPVWVGRGVRPARRAS